MIRKKRKMMLLSLLGAWLLTVWLLDFAVHFNLCPGVQGFHLAFQIEHRGECHWCATTALDYSQPAGPLGATVLSSGTWLFSAWHEPDTRTYIRLFDINTLRSGMVQGPAVYEQYSPSMGELYLQEHVYADERDDHGSG